MKRKFILFYLTIVLLLTACSKEEIAFNINQYIEIQEKGFSSYGTVDIALNYDRLYNDYKSVFIRNKIKRTQLIEEQPIKIIYNNHDRHFNTEELIIEFTDNPDSDIQLDEIFNQNIYGKKMYTVTQLTPLLEYNPFDDLIVTPVGLSGSGYIIAKIEHYGVDGSWEWPVDAYINNKVTNDEEIKLSINNLDIDEIQKRFGIYITQFETTYTVKDMPSKLIDERDITKISEDNFKALNKVVEDFVISGKNDENKIQAARSYEFVKALLLKGPPGEKICFIYHITDGFVPGGYYIHISPTDSLLVDNVNKALMLKDGSQLSSSFAKYDKETVRYTEKDKWGQDYERQGFMYDGIPYAGKRTLDEEINYIIETYIEYPTIYQ